MEPTELEATIATTPTETGPRRLAVSRVLAANAAWVGLAAILAVGLALRVFFFMGLVKVDPFTYADGAISMARWEPVYDPDITGDVYYTQYIRLPVVVPAAALYKLFGPNDVTSTAVPIAVSLAAAVVAFLFVRRALGELPALCAAGFVAVFPVAVINSTQFLPDVVQASFALLTVTCSIAALTFEGLTRRERAWLYFAAGAGLALAFYARGTAVAIVPPLAVVALVNWRRIGPEVVAAVGGSAAVLAVFQALLVGLGAKPLEDIRILYQLGNLGAATVAWDYADLLLTDRVYWPFVAAGVVGLALWTRVHGPRGWARNPAFALALVVVAQYVYFEFFMSLKDVVTWWKEPRYLLQLVFPLLLLSGAGCGLVLRELARFSAPGAVAAGAVGALGVLVVSAEAVDDEEDFYLETETNRWDYDERRVADFLAQFPGADVYVWDDDFARPLSYRMGGDGTLYSRSVSDDGRLHSRFEQDGTSRVTPGSYVVVLPGEDWWAGRTGASPGWELAWGGGVDPRVYFVDEPAADELEWREEPANATVGGARVTSAGLARPWIIPGQHTAIELVFDRPVAAGTRIPLLLQCDAPDGPVTELVVPRTADVLRSDVFLQSAPSVRVPAGCQVRTGGRDLVGVRVEAVTAVEGETLEVPGWEPFLNPRFSAGGSLLGRADSGPLAVPIPRLPGDEYWVELRLYDYGTGTGDVTATLNGTAARGTWGSAGGEPGVVRLVLHVPEAPAGNELRLEFAPGGQGAVLLDGVAVSAVEPPPVE
ncbi:MAG: glycosyltransferase family 39 protein [Dehalococcoidia bacterium]|nr:glycosyltransferase family 39 protein [Dehalococcoidia bacterium]